MIHLPQLRTRQLTSSMMRITVSHEIARILIGKAPPKMTIQMRRMNRFRAMDMAQKVQMMIMAMEAIQSVKIANSKVAVTSTKKKLLEGITINKRKAWLVGLIECRGR